MNQKQIFLGVLCNYNRNLIVTNSMNSYWFRMYPLLQETVHIIFIWFYLRLHSSVIPLEDIMASHNCNHS